MEASPSDVRPEGTERLDECEVKKERAKPVPRYRNNYVWLTWPGERNLEKYSPSIWCTRYPLFVRIMLCLDSGCMQTQAALVSIF